MKIKNETNNFIYISIYMATLLACRIATDAEQPMRVAPLLSICRAVGQSRIPPDALTLKLAD